MFGLDERLAAASDGGSILLVLAVAAVLGLRHATDPDHVAAVTTLVASGQDHARRIGAGLGLAWGLGHGASLVVFGLPVLVLNERLPDRVQQAAELAVAVVIVFLAVRLLVRWRRGLFHVHAHEHDGRVHAHLHGHEREQGHAHAHAERTRRELVAVGLVHGMGGSAAVAVLLLASVESVPLAAVSLVVIALCSAIAMSIFSMGVSATLLTRRGRRAFARLAPAVGATSAAFGVWYGLAALSVAPYPL